MGCTCQVFDMSCAAAQTIWQQRGVWCVGYGTLADKRYRRRPFCRFARVAVCFWKKEAAEEEQREREEGQRSFFAWRCDLILARFRAEICLPRRTLTSRFCGVLRGLASPCE